MDQAQRVKAIEPCTAESRRKLVYLASLALDKRLQEINAITSIISLLSNEPNQPSK